MWYLIVSIPDLCTLTYFVFSSKSLLSFRREMAQPRLSMATRGLGVGGKIEGRHILIIAISEHHVDNMNR